MNHRSPIALTGITVPPERHRALRPEIVDELAASMQAQGQLQPILLRPRDAAGYWLVAGRHRLEAAKRLKWETVDALICSAMSADEAELAEIDENLCRAGLSPAERAAHQAARKAIYERLHPETRKGATGRGRAKKSQVETSKPADAYIEDTARKTGKSRATVAREAHRGETIPDVASLASTSLDKGDELDALAKLPAAERDEVMAEAKAGKKVSAKKQAAGDVKPAKKKTAKPKKKPQPAPAKPDRSDIGANSYGELERLRSSRRRDGRIDH
jgi:hypothetical protein